MTFSQVYSKYLASGTTGNCASLFCHGGIGSASSCYSWLQSKGQINGTSTPALTSSRSSVVSWYGGNMPPSGPSASGAAQAVADMNAWAAAGGQNN